MDDGVILVFKERAGCAGGGKGILITENKSFTLSTLLDEAICFEKPFNPIILNDQGGAVMDVSYEKTATLRAQDHGHPPVICFRKTAHPMHRGGGTKDGR